MKAHARIWLPVMLALAVTSVPMAAQESSGEIDAEALRQELAQAREELGTAARRVAELSAQLGRDAGTRTIRHFGQAAGPRLGVVLGVSEQAGVRLQAVTPGGPAAQAGLASGDVITAVDGHGIAGAQPRERLREARRLLSGLEENQVVQLDFERDGHPGRADVTARPIDPQALIGSLADGDLGLDLKDFNFNIDMDKFQTDLQRALSRIDLGQLSELAPLISDSLPLDAWRWQHLRLAPLDDDLGRYFGTSQGVLVLQPRGEGLAPLRSGDVIVSIDGERVGQPEQAMRRLARAEPGQTITLGVMRDRRHMDLDLVAPDRPDPFRQFRSPPEPPPPPSPPSSPRSPPANGNTGVHL